MNMIINTPQSPEIQIWTPTSPTPNCPENKAERVEEKDEVTRIENLKEVLSEAGGPGTPLPEVTELRPPLGAPKWWGRKVGS